ncbi:hypothetical protein CP97_01410 [Aurantiacibacter atlanticus]|uniref:Polysaccharide biosynthesis protein C-terminal domain-containing protein n=2 Tax=Aurantiacibacter atlanticus TaxID=1648404 RepID=A0A0H4VD11_9SPHN|nr:hypothetical protein CP97_01410 [Aurantiacibacter atlanticus]
MLLIYVGQADFGIARAATQRIAALGRGRAEDQIATAWTALAASAFMGLVLAVVTYVLATLYFAGPLEVSEEVRTELLASAVIMGGCTFVVTIFAAMYGCLAGRAMFGYSTLGSFVGNSASQLLPLACALFWTIDLYYLLLATLLARFLGTLPAAYGLWKEMLRGHRVKIARDALRELVGFGKWVMALSVTRPAMVMADRALIGAQLGAIAVTAYAVPFQIASRLQMIPRAVLIVLFPKMAELGPEQSRAAARGYLLLFATGFAPILIGLSCMVEPLLNLWLGNELDERSVLLARILLLGFWFASLSGVMQNFTMARGDSRYVAVLYVLEVVPYLAVLYVAMAQFGLPGAALAFSARYAVEFIIIGFRENMIDWRFVGQIAASLGALVASVALHEILYGWIASLAAATILGGIAAANAFVLLPKDFWQRLFQNFRRSER